MSNLEFHDTANGGWFCDDCKQYIHVDMIHAHKCSPGTFFQTLTK